ncbi:MAG: MFS transporter, partial [Acidimicrobiales bacterium]
MADLFDQRQPFGRLALTHVLMTAGDTLFAVSLAGSLFFSISPTAAQDKVLLYLLLTMAPFAVVAPALGPLVDRSRGARRATVVASALGRAALCPLLAADIHSLLLFPLAFAMLVLSKVYLVTKGALVPEMAALGLIGHPPGSDPPSTLPRLAPPTRMPTSTPPYGTPMVGDGVGDDLEDSGKPNLEGAPDLAGLNARLGLLASVSAFVFALPAVGMLKLAGAQGVLWLDFFVFLAAVVAGARLPVRQRRRTRGSGRRRVRVRAIPMVPVSQSLSGPAPDLPREPTDDELDLAAFRPIATSEVLLALMPMSVLKAELGFLTFLLAFGLRRQGAGTWWFGLLLGAITAGALIGVLLVARLRRVFSEQQILVASMWLVAVVAGIISSQSSRYFQVVVALAVGVAGAISKPSFDALVQRHVEVFNQGRAFARFETRLQLVWVVGAFVPVVVTLPITTGNLIMAIVAAL